MSLSTSYWAADHSQPVLDLTVGEALREAAAEAPHTTALVEGAADPAARRRWSYAGLLEASERAARALLGRFAPGDRVAVWANNLPEWVILELAAGLAGITVVTVNPALRAQELAYVLGQSQAEGIFLVPAYRASPMAEMVQQVRGDLPSSAPTPRPPLRPTPPPSARPTPRPPTPSTPPRPDPTYIP